MADAFRGGVAMMLAKSHFGSDLVVLMLSGPVIKETIRTG